MKHLYYLGLMPRKSFIFAGDESNQKPLPYIGPATTPIENQMKKVLLLLTLLVCSTLEASEKYELFDNPILAENFDDCSAENTKMCIEKSVTLVNYDKILISITLNGNLFLNEDDHPALYLKYAMLAQLLTWNEQAAKDHNVGDAFINLDLSGNRQNNIVIVGKITYGDKLYVGYYELDDMTGYPAHNISDKFDDPIDFYIKELEESLYHNVKNPPVEQQ